MSGGLVQLVAVGIQDQPINKDPEITFWKSTFKRYSHFACEAINNSFSGSVNFGKSSCSALVTRNGDLADKMYLRCKVSLTRTSDSGKMAFVKRLGHAMIKEVKVNIGGQNIEKMTGTWMDMNYELSRKSTCENSLNVMLGDTEDMTVLSEHNREAILYVPLPFWFSHDSGVAIPLIALQYHEVRVDISFEDASRLVCATADCSWRASIDDCQLVTSYVFLDAPERKLMATSSHEYLIRQSQCPGPDTLSERTKKYRLTFNHPVSFVVWCARLGKYNGNHQYLAYHPKDMDFVKKRTAEMLYLLHLTVAVDTEGGFNVQTSDSGNQYVMNESSSPLLRTVVDQLKSSVVLVTAKSETYGQVEAELPSNFLDNPFGHVEFLDDSWKTIITKELMSTPVSQLGLNTSHPFYQTLSNQFVAVNMPSNYGVYFDGSSNPVEEANIQLNGADRFAVREGNWFNYVVPYESFSNTPCDGVNAYSFALSPEESTPTGTINFSRIDYTALYLKLTAEANSNLGADSTLNVFAVNHNLLRVMSGMGGLAFSN